MSEQHTTQSSIAESPSRTEPLSLPSAIVAASAVLLVATVAGLGLLKFYCLAPDNYPGGLHPCVKDSIQSAVAIAGIVTVAAAAWGVVNELRKQQIARDQHVRAEHKGNELRADDLRWRRAQEARKLLQDIHNHPLASVAVQMMDWWANHAQLQVPRHRKRAIRAFVGNNPRGRRGS